VIFILCVLDIVILIIEILISCILFIVCVMIVLDSRVVVCVGGVGRVISIVASLRIIPIVPIALSYGDMQFFLTYRVRRTYSKFTIIGCKELKRV